MDHLLSSSALALRNLIRNGRRTLSTLLAITIGLVGLTLLDGYITFSMNGLKETVIHSGTGHLQVVRSPAFFDEGDSDPFPFMLDKSDAIERALRAIPEVQAVLPALTFYAVVSAGAKNATVQVTALPVASAAREMAARRIVAGKELAAGESGRLLLGKGVARKLDVAPGGTVTLFALSEGGGVNTQSFQVSGTTTTLIAAADNATLFMDLADAQGLIGSGAVPQIIVFLKSTADTARVAAQIERASAGSVLAGLTVRSWEELSPYYRQANGAYQMVLAIARLIVLLVALFSISGSLSLSVLERLREIGTLRAVGTKRGQVLVIFLLEGLFLGLAGALAGGLVGGAISGLINLTGGIRMPPQPGMSEAFAIRFTPEMANLLRNGLWVLLAALVGAFFPGSLASRRGIAELLRSK